MYCCLLRTSLFTDSDRGWNDEHYNRLIELVIFAREIEKVGGADGILALASNQHEGVKKISQAPAKTPISWAQSVPVQAKVSAPGSYTRVTVVLTTQDGHNATCIFQTTLAALVIGTYTVDGSLNLNSWDLLKAGTNDVTFDIRSGVGQLVVNGLNQGELVLNIPSVAVGSIFTSSFNWSA